ncbi:type I DNA topoisomerase [Pseudothermotoga thermarum]|uniref:DNA topoisomerase 1 n=1 Tax=Pseudothermotoga thermarum DSM 5069 TaxID=688269 RepID=F7YV43_9THEM|nr:type I DNA topoisomerase [Pseudothermotoga thermarum]AEH50341.1 DNA topoisomerase I [Pseudothermotoga thermarum DSM 5069]
MSKKVIIVESPAKAHTIQEILNDEYEVLASKGHVRDLPEDEFGVNLKKDFEPKFEIIKGKEKTIQELKEKTKGKSVFLASDMDREGEAIAWHLSLLLGLKNGKNRIIFSEITPKAIREALKNPREIDMKKVEAQIARRILDRIVGYKISPLLWRALKANLSAGRVQSAALRLLCERELQRYKFEPKKFWRVEGYIGEIKFKLTHIDGKKIEMQDVNEKLAKQIEQAVVTLNVTRVSRRTIRKKSPDPFITSTLQQEAANKLGFSVSKTMQIAQQLYEGVETKEGHKAFITYMRTDSTRISDYARQQAEKYIKENFGEKYIGEVRQLKKTKNVQDAHEAIRPVDVYVTPERAKNLLQSDQYKLYKLIWDRFLASQMADAVYEETTIFLESGQYGFEAKVERPIFDGFELIYGKTASKNVKIPQGTVKVDRWEIVEDETKPPARYTEASMVRALEAKGIGRPSTYATIISTLLERKYVVKRGKELVPTVIGFVVNNYLQERFPSVVDLEFTARMEEELDKIEQGKKNYKEILRDFYNDFSDYLNKAQESWFSIDFKTNKLCECGESLTLRVGKYGLYLTCKKCSKSQSVRLDELAVLDKDTMYFYEENFEKKFCPSCGEQLKQVRGKYGVFQRCEKCGKTYGLFAEGECPKCGSAVERKTSKSNKVYYKCTNQDCDFISWLEPAKEKCPNCQNQLYYKVIGSRKRLFCANCNKTIWKRKS